MFLGFPTRLPEDGVAIPAIKTYFKAYLISDQVRHIIESRQFTDLATSPVFPTRDILVGKVPAPKSQVDQITITLIYKFMDDMDAGPKARRT